MYILTPNIRQKFVDKIIFNFIYHNKFKFSDNYVHRVHMYMTRSTESYGRQMFVLIVTLLLNFVSEKDYMCTSWILTKHPNIHTLEAGTSLSFMPFLASILPPHSGIRKSWLGISEEL